MDDRRAATAGREINEHLAVEPRVGATTKNSATFVTDPAIFAVAVPATLDVQADRFLSLFVRGTTSDLGGGVRLLGVVGGTSIKNTTSISLLGRTVEPSDTDKGFSFGGGVEKEKEKEKEINDRLSVNLEYLRYYDDTDNGVTSTLDGLSGVAGVKF